MASPNAAHANTLLVLSYSSCVIMPSALAGLHSSGSSSITGTSSFLLLFILDLTFDFCFLVLPFAVAGEGARYFLAILGLLSNGIFSKCPLSDALIIVCCGGLWKV